MLKLDLKREPYWLEFLPGVRIKVRPATTPIMLPARAAAAQEAETGDDKAVTWALALVKHVARAVIVEWEGIGDAEGNFIEPKNETIDALMEIPAAADAFDRLYLTPAYRLEQEKNG